MDENNKLVKTGKLSTSFKTGMAAKLEQAKQAGTLASETVINYASYPNRIVVAVDDSGSMSADMGAKTRIQAAREATEGFLSVCSPADTVVGVYTISTDKQESLTWNYIPLLQLAKTLEATGGTPTFSTLEKIIEKEPVSRVVVISDGASAEGAGSWWGRENEENKHPILSERAIKVLNKYRDKKVIVDAVFIGLETDKRGIEEMKAIAEYCGGVFIHFKDAKDFGTKFKYLAPAFYGMLTSGEIKL